jgi:uncharacterized membrane protein
MTRVLLWIYPKSWRQAYGEEFIALLDDLDWPLSGILDAIRQGIRERIDHNQLGIIRLVSFAYFAVIEYCAVKNNITNNMFWMPHGIISYLTLAAVCTSLIVLFFPKLAPFASRQIQK